MPQLAEALEAAIAAHRPKAEIASAGQVMVSELALLVTDIGACLGDEDTLPAPLSGETTRRAPRAR